MSPGRSTLLSSGGNSYEANDISLATGILICGEKFNKAWYDKGYFSVTRQFGSDTSGHLTQSLSAGCQLISKTGVDLLAGQTFPSLACTK